MNAQEIKTVLESLSIEKGCPTIPSGVVIGAMPQAPKDRGCYIVDGSDAIEIFIASKDAKTRTLLGAAIRQQLSAAKVTPEASGICVTRLVIGKPQKKEPRHATTDKKASSRRSD